MKPKQRQCHVYGSRLKLHAGLAVSVSTVLAGLAVAQEPAPEQPAAPPPGQGAAPPPAAPADDPEGEQPPAKPRPTEERRAPPPPTTPPVPQQPAPPHQPSVPQQPPPSAPPLPPAPAAQAPVQPAPAGPPPAGPPPGPGGRPGAPASAPPVPPLAQGAGGVAPPGDGAVHPPAEETSPSEGTWLGLELVGGLNVSGRFPTTDRDSRSVEPVDGTVRLTAWLDFDRSFALGLGLEHSGLGKERFEIEGGGNALDAGYSVETLWLSGRWALDDERPALFVAAGLGPSMQVVRGTGTRFERDFVGTGQSFECNERGGFGGGAYVAGGVEVDMTDHFSFHAELRGAGHLLSGAEDALDGCAPGIGPAIYGVAGLGLEYRFAL